MPPARRTLLFPPMPGPYARPARNRVQAVDLAAQGRGTDGVGTVQEEELGVPPIGDDNRIQLPATIPEYRAADLAPVYDITLQHGAKRDAAVAWLFTKEMLEKRDHESNPVAWLRPPTHWMLIRAVQAGWAKVSWDPCDNCKTQNKLCVVLLGKEGEGCWTCYRSCCSLKKNPRAELVGYLRATISYLRGQDQSDSREIADGLECLIKRI